MSKMARSIAQIKKEPGPASLTPSQSRLGPPSQTTMRETVGRPDPRGIRSGAPSVATRRPAPSARASDGTEIIDLDEEPVLLEIKNIGQNPTESFGLSGSQSAQGSFMGPSRAFKDFGHKLKAINDALGELQARGIQHVASLPELVLVGDQSSGKSSLMSAIAGLTLPRNSGTCTRCPIHIRVSRAAEWSCRVYLKVNYKYVPRDHPITRADVTDKDKFPPWVLLDSNNLEKHEFKTVRDKFDAEEIETVLRCAQAAILNPTKPYQMFVPKLKGEASAETRERDLLRINELEAQAEAQFSPNTVALEVKGPDLADLNFYDLPGVFMSAKREEDTFLERVVRNLARQYMARKNAIVLWAVPMNQDADNSYAFSLIRGMGAGNRCVGVMTKADLLPEGSSHSWIAMLEGKAHQTGLGYFITSRQGDDLEQQNTMEEAFFNRTADNMGQWPQVFDKYKESCGVEKLKAFLSQRLGEEFGKVLPEVKVKVHDRIDAIDHQLEAFPVPPRNPEMEIMKSLAEFSRDVRDRVREQSFLNRWDALFMEPFKQKIIGLKPKYNVREFTRAPFPENSRTMPIVLLDDDSPTPVSRKRPATAGQGTAAVKRQRPGHGNPVTPVKSEVVDRQGIFSATATPGSRHSTLAPTGRARSLMDIRNLIRENAPPGQPGVISGGVYQPLFTEAAGKWLAHVDTFVAQTFDFLQSEIMRIMNLSFGHILNTAVYKRSREHMAAFIASHRAELSAQLRLIHSLEAQRLFTKDEDSLARNMASEKKVLARHRHHFRWLAHNNPADDNPQALRKMEELTEEELATEATRMAKEATRMLPDPFDPELGVAAYVRGYYLTSANRFIDNVAIHVMSGLFPRVAAIIDVYLHEKLGLTGGQTTLEMLQELMSESPETEHRRRELRVERANLEEAMEIIVGLETTGDDEPTQTQPEAGTDEYGAPANGYTNGMEPPRSYAQSAYGNGIA
ncbi:P-loop containing nucleoside triphosphate hydrolase protein [Podospora conica]|nr:P-loop containing nucleoside triphosphate hydrolase protein [Schizothecium conicum]